MRSLSRSTFVVIAALMLGIAFSAISAMAQQTANDFAGRRFSNKLVISEFRADGPGGTGDEYVEICNASDAAFTILRDTGETGVGVTGIGVYSFQQATNNIVRLFSIKDGVVFQPGQCFLGAGLAYSLGGYAGGSPDVIFSNDVCDPDGTPCTPAGTTDGIETDTGVAIFGTDQATFGVVGGLPAVCMSAGCDGTVASGGLATIEDAIGFNVVNTITFPGIAAPNSPIFREGAGLTPIDATAVSPIPQYAWVRRSCGVQANGTRSTTLGTCGLSLDREGVIQDTDNNNNDHFGLETGASVTLNQGGTVARSGQPVATNSTVDRRNANPGPVTFSDFGGVLTPGSSSPGPVVAILGAPGPEGFTGIDGNSAATARAPRKRRFNSAVAALNIGSALFDPSQGATFNTPNRERVFAVPRPAIRADLSVGTPNDNNEASSPLGTFAFRFTLQNLTGASLSRLRWRLMDGTVDNRPTTDSGPSAPFEVAVTGQPFAVLRFISSTTARVFVNSGADQNCTHVAPAAANAGQTQCGAAGFKLSQGTILDPTQPQSTSPGNATGTLGSGAAGCVGATTAASPCNPGSANTVLVGAPIGGGVNSGVVLEQNLVAGSGAGDFPSNAGAGTPAAAGNPNRASGLERGTGTFILGTPLANNEKVSVEFRFGVQKSGRFYLMISPEADNGTAGP